MGVAVLPELRITTRNIPDIHIVALHGELDIASVDGLTDALVEIAGSTVVVDLSGLTFMDSTGIGALVVAKNRVLSKGLGQLVVTRPTAIVREAMEIVGLGAWIVEWSPEWDE
jgi:anti-anti-sigma factor